MPEFYSTQDVADRLGVSIFTIRRYIQAGKLEAVKLDGGYRVSRTALDEFLARRSMPAVDAPARAEPPRPGAAATASAQPATIAHD